MSTYDDRLATLERKVAMLELRRVHDESMARESTPSALILNLKEINQNMTVLLEIVAKQEESIGELKDGLGRVEHRLDSIDRRTEDLDGRLISFEQSVNNRFEAQNQRMTSFEQSVNNRFEVVDKKQDQMLSMLSTLTSKLQQET